MRGTEFNDASAVENQSAIDMKAMYLACLWIVRPTDRNASENFTTKHYLISVLIQFRRKFDEISIDQYLIDVHDSTTIDCGIVAQYHHVLFALLSLDRIALEYSRYTFDGILALSK